MSQPSGISSALTEEQQMLQNLAREFAREQMIPAAEHYDRTAEFPVPIIEKARQVGAMGGEERRTGPPGLSDRRRTTRAHHQRAL